MDSDYPIPAGGYKLLDGKNVKDVKVSFSNNLPVTQTDATLITNFPSVAIAGLPIKGEITIQNTGTQRLSPQVLSLVSSTLSPSTQMIHAKSIPPFGSQTWEVGFVPTSFLTKTDAGFTIHFAPDSALAEKTSEQKIKIAPFFLTPWGMGGIILGILTFIFIAVITKIRRGKS